MTVLDKIIEIQTWIPRSIGFNADVCCQGREKCRRDPERCHCLKILSNSVLIPEFMGRVPVVVSLDALDEESTDHAF